MSAITHQLKPAEISFIHLYTTNGCNVADAARRAGMSLHVARRFVATEQCQRGLRQVSVDVVERCEITMDEVVDNARELVRMGRFGREGKAGEIVRDSGALAKGNEQLINLAGFYARKQIDVDVREAPSVSIELAKRMAELILADDAAAIELVSTEGGGGYIEREPADIEVTP